MRRLLVVLLLAACSKKSSEPEWDGTQTFWCSGDRVVTFTGKKLKSPGPAVSPMIGANERCQITLVDCDLEGDLVIRADGNAKIVIERGRIQGSNMGLEATEDASITIRGATVGGKDAIQTSGKSHASVEGGSVRGTEHAIGAWGTSVVDVKGTTIDGPVFADKEAKITGVAEDKIEHQPDMASIVSTTCGLLAQCYRSAKQFGRIGGRVSVTTDAKGIITQASFDKNDNIPKDVKTCIDGSKGKPLDGATKAGTHVCRYDGVFLENDNGKMDWWPSFKPE